MSEIQYYVPSLQAEVERMKAGVGWLIAEVKRLIADNARLKAERDEAQAEVERLTTERDDDRRREYGYSQQMMDAMVKERAGLQAEVQRLKSQVIWLEANCKGGHDE